MNIEFLDKKGQIALQLEDMYSKFGYTKYRMNKFEEYSFYMENEKFLDDNRVISFNSPSGKLLALKPDITMSIVKNYGKSTTFNHKIYYNESVFRIPKGDSEFKEIKQIGVEYIGEIDTYQSLEILNLAVKSLEKFDDNYVLCVSNMALILKILEDLQLSKNEKSVVLEYMKQKNTHDLEKYLKEKDIKNGEYLRSLLIISRNITKGIKQLKELFKDTPYIDEIISMENVLKFYPNITSEDKIQLDFSYITSTDYYNGLVFVGYLQGLSVPALTGGRYDNLLSKMGIEDSCALGFALDLSAINKILISNSVEKIKIRYDKNDDISKLIVKSNELYTQGKTFCINK